MFQRNIKTGFQRPIRCAIRKKENEDKIEDGSKFYYWEWYDGNISCSYSPYATKILEEKFQIYENSKSNNSFDIKIFISDNQKNSKKVVESIAEYRIDLNKMEQTNKKSGFGRKIKREISGIFF